METLKEIKKVISVKNPAQNAQLSGRLPPIGGRAVPMATTSASGQSVLPPISSDVNQPDSAETQLTSTSPDSPPSYSDVTSRFDNTLNNNTEVSNGSATHQPAILTDSRTRVFTTSHTHTANNRTTTLSDALMLPLPDRETIKKNGVRTYPVIAVLSVFFCCPLFGLSATILTLMAENNFYRGYYEMAHREAFVARIFILLAYIFGILTLLSMIIVLIVRNT